MTIDGTAACDHAQQSLGLRPWSTAAHLTTIGQLGTPTAEALAPWWGNLEHLNGLAEPLKPSNIWGHRNTFNMSEFPPAVPAISLPGVRTVAAGGIQLAVATGDREFPQNAGCREVACRSPGRLFELAFVIPLRRGRILWQIGDAGVVERQVGGKRRRGFHE